MFKCLEFIDERLRKLTEAADVEEADTDVEKDDTNVEETPQEEQDPSQIADAGAGDFVSPIAKANWVNMMLKILKNNRPDIIIPTEFETVTTDNADKIIEFIKGATMVSDDDFGDELNNA